MSRPASETRSPESTAEHGGHAPAYRSFVGPPDSYDIVGALQFNVMTEVGLREHHFLLDVGCGSLRGGRLFIPYLLPGRYFGIEPHRWLIDDGLDRELGRDIVRIKRPTFSDVDDFHLTVFGRRFDYILAQSIFSHAARPQIERCLDEASRALSRDGTLVATFVRDEQDYADDEWSYPAVVGYRLETLGEMAQGAGFRLSLLDRHHPHGQTWFQLRHRDDG